MYLNFFNTKSLTGIKSHLSLQCTVILPDRTVQTYDPEMLATYSTHWERAPTPIDLREIKAIKGGVWTLLRDWDGV
jgi:hypothetical protein